MTRLQTLSISAFRGIRDSLDLDFSHSINLMYAPNGTGKTSVCDAVEWLLTGQVKRLGVISSTQGAELRCALSEDNLETSVTGVITVGGERIRLSRTLNAIYWERGENRREKVSPTNLLEVLAPSAIEPDAYARHANSSRQIWLRGTRFLSAESLGALLDSDDSSLENRERLFSDLLGVGHLLETERLLDNYSKTINQALKQQQEKVDDKASSIMAREERLGENLLKDEASITLVAHENLTTARNILRIPTIADDETIDAASLRQNLIETTGELNRRKAELDRKRKAEIEISQDWPERLLIERQQKESTERIQQVAPLIAEKNNALELARVALEDSTNKVRAFEPHISQAADRLQRLASAAAYADSYAQQFDALSGSPPITVEAAVLLSDKEGSESLRSKRATTLKELAAEVDLRQSEWQELAELVRQLDMIIPNILSAEKFAERQATLSRLRAESERALKEYADAAGPFQQLQLLSKSVLASLENEHNCPVCQHDWKNPVQLSEAIQRALTSTPATIIALKQQADEAEARLVSEESSVSAYLKMQADYFKLTERSKALRSSHASFVARLAEFGISQDSDTIERAIEIAQVRLSLADGVQRFREELSAVQGLLGISVEQSMGFSAFVSHANILGKSAIERLNAAYLDAKNAQIPIKENYNSLSVSLKTLTDDLQLLRTRLGAETHRLNALKENWQILAGQSAWTDEAFETAANELRQNSEKLSRAQQSIEQAGRSIQDSAQHAEISLLRSELTALIAERDRLTKLYEAAHQAKLAYDERRQRHVHEQMEEIVRVISALFLRMQANEVYDRIVEGADSQPLSWRALCNGTPLDPQTKFSQGQRQDFALAIFLARARGLRGSFFMDEPLTHLDDLNRVALLDVFRAIALENDGELSFILTTASRPIARHFIEKLSRVTSGTDESRKPVLNVIELEGNPRVGIKKSTYAS